jgi:AbrB family looped-hinge helix DNA binding protein
MPITKIGPKHQVTIPQEIFARLRLEVGDYLDVQTTDQGILMIPKKLIPKDQEWFYSKEWQEKEREADAAIARGDVSGPFETVEEVMEHLRGEKTGQPKNKRS